MATYIAAQTYVNYTNTYNVTQFRAWIQSVHDALAAVGLVQTSDTGQTDIVSAAPAVSGSVFEIWRFSDAAQGTDPVFFKINYHRASSSSVFLSIEVGQGSNGSGTLTGVTTTAAMNLSCALTITSGTGTAAILAYFNDGIFWLADGAQCTAARYLDVPRCFVLIARTRDTSGALDARGVVVLSPNGPQTNDDGGVNVMQFLRWSPSTFVGAQTSQFGGFVTTPANPVNGVGDTLAWPLMYYDLGVGVVQLQACFVGPRAGVPSTPTAFDADPFGLGSRRWISWQQGPMADPKMQVFYSTYGVLNLPWDP